MKGVLNREQTREPGSETPLGVLMAVIFMAVEPVCSSEHGHFTMLLCMSLFWGTQVLARPGWEVGTGEGLEASAAEALSFLPCFPFLRRHFVSWCIS